MVNFLSSDITRLEASLVDLHYIWIAPLQIIWITYVTFYEIGWAALIGISVFLLFVPVQGIVAFLLINNYKNHAIDVFVVTFHI